MTTVLEPAPPDTGHDRTPPHDLDAERAVLGGMLLSKDAITEVADILTPGDYFRSVHATIHDAICDLYAANEPATAISVAAHLADTGQLAKVGGAPYLHDCINAAPLAAQAGYYARIVADRAARRRLIEAATAALRLGYTTDGRDADDLIDAAQQAMYDLTTARRAGDWSQLVDLFQPALDSIEAAAATDGPRGIPTGFTDLDRLLGGLLPGQMVVVAGRPGQGKSTLAADVARHAAIKSGLPSVIFSLEMSKMQIVMRIMAAEARIPLNTLKTGKLTDDDWTRLARRMGEIETAPLFIDDTPNMTLMEIRAKARRLKQRHDLKLIVIDYLGLMTSPKRVESRQQEVADLSRGLKLLAKEVDCPVIAVHQVNRENEKRQDKRPQLSDLRDSGSVEQDSDVVIFVHRDDYYDKESPRAGEADVIVAKHRDGATDTVTVAAQLHLSRFVDMAIV